jgi:hypothetical protein
MSNTTEQQTPAKKRCFVIMGFGTKTDFATGRKLDLDYSYHALIKPVVEGRNIECIRADEIKHSGSIDMPMYQQLLSADVVIADLSTSNANAFYELGIRHALRPYTTIIIAEQQMAYPFDLNHILISKYNHLGLNIDYYEVLRFQKYLGETLDAVLQSIAIDSPVYTFLDDLIPPSLKASAQQVAKKVDDALKAQVSADQSASEGDPAQNQTLSLLVRQGEEAIKNKNYELAQQFFQSAIQLSNVTINENGFANNPYLVQRLAFATYKTKQPDVVTALLNAIRLLDQIDLRHTNDPETVALAGKIEKRLYNNNQGEEHLANAILYYERSYFLINTRYNAVNLAFLYNARVVSNLFSSKEDKVADMINANRVRQETLKKCEKDWKRLSERQYDDMAMDNIAIDQRALDYNEQFWILVNKADSYFGLGDMAAYKETLAKAQEYKVDTWMMDSFTAQINKLRPILQQYGQLLPGGWKEE